MHPGMVNIPFLLVQIYIDILLCIHRERDIQYVHMHILYIFMLHVYIYLYECINNESIPILDLQTFFDVT
jgi:hypothetical protein